MAEAAESPESKAKKEVFAELNSIVQLDDSGRAEAEELWTETLGNFFAHRDRAAAKWRIPDVHDYGMSAVTDIGLEAKRIAGTGLVNRSVLRKAAIAIIRKYRPPVEIGSSELCTEFRLK